MKPRRAFPPILMAAQMRAADDAAIAAGTPSGELMERAGRLAAEAMLAFAMPGEVLVLCGPGNNGGDGYVIARHLAAAGLGVRVAAALPPASADCRAMAARWDGPVSPADAAAPAEGFVDALFGTGLARPLSPDMAAQLARLAAGARVRVAVDLPSGADSDSGAYRADLPGYDLTVTFAARKRAHVLVPAREACGRVVVADIGLGALASDVRLNLPPALPAPAADTHKYARGIVLVLAGEAGGAARLAARAALRAGAGLVRVVAASEAAAEHRARLDAVMVAEAEDAAALQALLADRRPTALVAGPGLGRDARAEALLGAALASDRAAVFDADAFSLRAGTPEAFRRAAATVLTPHEGEFTRLFGTLPGSRIDQARKAATDSGAVVVSKGADTVIAAPDGRAVVNGHAAPWLATAGSGDVLAGIIAALLAQGLDAFDAACAGVWLHGDAGRRCGPGCIAEDLPEALPAVLRALE